MASLAARAVSSIHELVVKGANPVDTTGPAVGLGV